MGITALVGLGTLGVIRVDFPKIFVISGTLCDVFNVKVAVSDVTKAFKANFRLLVGYSLKFHDFA
jgi:hypothetical protein